MFTSPSTLLAQKWLLALQLVLSNRGGLLFRERNANDKQGEEGVLLRNYEWIEKHRNENEGWCLLLVELKDINWIEDFMYAGGCCRCKAM